MIDDIKSFLLSESFDNNLREYFAHITNKDDWLVNENYFKAYSGIKHPNHNIFFQDTVRNEDLDDTIETTIEYFTEKGVPFTWWITDDTLNETNKKILIQKKLRYYGEIVGLAVKLENLEKMFDTPNALYVEALKSNKKLEDWSRIATAHFGLRNDKAKIIHDKLSRHDFYENKPEIKKYIAYLSGEPVAVSTLINKFDVAAIFDDEVIPYYSKYIPFNLSVIYYPLKDALKMGFKVGIAFADTKRINNYKILGFEEVLKYHKFIYIPKRK